MMMMHEDAHCKIVWTMKQIFSGALRRVPDSYCSRVRLGCVKTDFQTANDATTFSRQKDNMKHDEANGTKLRKGFFFHTHGPDNEQRTHE